VLGDPTDLKDACNARLFISDDYGDNRATMRCQLAPAHDGVHCERFQRAGGEIVITWVADERRRCSYGCGQWEHLHEIDQCPAYLEDV